MKKIIMTIIIFLIIIVPSKIYAKTKEDIFKYIDSQEVCDSESKTLLNQYKLQFKRMVKERELSEVELDYIFDSIKNSCDELKKNGVCKKSDLENVSQEVIEVVEDNIIDAVTTVIDAPSIYGDDKSTISGIVFDRENMTIHIISNDALADKFELNTKSFNYVGPNKIVLHTTYILIGIFVITTFLIIFLRKRKYLVLPILALDIISFSLTLGFLVLAKPINVGLGYLSMMQRPKTLVNKEIIVNDNHEIMQYPNYYDEYAVLKIDSIGINEKVAFGDGADVLAGDIGHATTSYMPGEGNTIIYSGHNYKLNNLDRIKVNDEIVIETSYGVFTYQVNEIKIMNSNEYNDIEFDTGKEVLVLYTCYPFSSLVYGDKRFVVFASLTKERWGQK